VFVDDSHAVSAAGIRHCPPLGGRVAKVHNNFGITQRFALKNFHFSQLSALC
jgi:hypothetical protein